MESSRVRRWAARGALVLAAAALLVLLRAANGRGLWLVGAVVGTAVVIVAGVYWILRDRGLVRWLALVLAVAAPVALLVAFLAQDLVLSTGVAALLWTAAVGSARIALLAPAVTAPPGRPGGGLAQPAFRRRR